MMWPSSDRDDVIANGQASTQFAAMLCSPLDGEWMCICQFTSNTRCSLAALSTKTLHTSRESLVLRPRVARVLRLNPTQALQ
jgi:hypothetical protein